MSSHYRKHLAIGQRLYEESIKRGFHAMPTPKVGAGWLGISVAEAKEGKRIFIGVLLGKIKPLVHVAPIDRAGLKRAIQDRVRYYGHNCWMCGNPYADIDHVKPQSKGGAGLPANLRPICRACNLGKLDSWPLDRESLLSYFSAT